MRDKIFSARLLAADLALKYQEFPDVFKVALTSLCGLAFACSCLPVLLYQLDKMDGLCESHHPRVADGQLITTYYSCK